MFSYLQIRCGTEALIFEEIFGFLFCLDLESLRPLRIRAEDTHEILKFPLTNVIVRRIHSMNIPFDRVTFITDHETAK